MMIPRRRIALEGRDALAWLLAPWQAASRRDAQVRAFEAAFARSIGVGHARATASGRLALGLIVDGLGLRPGDELVIPAYTLGELLPLLESRGLVLVPADIDPDTYNMTPTSVQACLGPRSRAVLAVHMLGAPCDIEGILAVTQAHGVPLIEDCAHATGARVAGRVVGSFGRAALFSLEPTKPVAAFGGGVLATADDALAAYVDTALSGPSASSWPALRRALFKGAEELVVRSPAYGVLARHLFDDKRANRFEAFYRRANARRRGPQQHLSAFQANLALPRLARLDARNQRLEAACAALAAELPARFRPQRRDAFGTPAFYQCVARFDGDIRQLRRAALARGVDLGIGEEIMSDTAHRLGRDDCPGAARVFAEAVMLPLYDGLTPRRRDHLLDTLHELARELP
ncbi:DegT/DnrJ/EryC1/StrS family aminotransferase [Halomonas alkalisoli]|uniref:DegT/DnrJ/EryC1/StrS family aminotransferase n=1 Tax=Halomonas alkalisoli TaxID=2907158 RepID=UPI001F20A860|nr:DegT/DnrJ/EryC1/StrS family aminotransferase [Halomonas alkalisoli]MCE9682596.1 DegT/DnrJ/EryC1/StrS family aminotransferase [Halomonas alkalisoli]